MLNYVKGSILVVPILKLFPVNMPFKMRKNCNFFSAILFVFLQHFLLIFTIFILHFTTTYNPLTATLLSFLL